MQTTMMPYETSGSRRVRSHFGLPDDARAFIKRFALRGRDPAVADENLYRYCENEPTDATDPSGRNAILDIYVSQIEKYLNTPGGEQAAAEIASRMYAEIASLAQYVYPLAAAFMQNWLDGAPKNPYIINDHVQAAITDKSGPRDEVAKQVRLAVMARNAPAGTIDIGFFNVKARSGDYHYALGDFRVRFTGCYKIARGRISLTGTWAISDTYHWTKGVIANILGTIIKDDYALLVEEYCGAKPFQVLGAWYGTMTF